MSQRKYPKNYTSLAKQPPRTDQPKIAKRSDSYGAQIAPKAQSRTRRDVASWQSALKAADNVERPRRARLQNIYTDIMQDAHLSSQIELRRLMGTSTLPILKRDGVIDEEATALLVRAPWRGKLDREALNADLYGHTLVEFLTTPDGALDVAVIPRTNVVPEAGLVLLREDDDRGIEYRNAREYGTWILEFGDSHNYGLLNKTVPHILFKRFAQSCWSELCEIYGIPPRVLKTNTQDTEMLSRAEAMMRDMGSASWYVIDSDEVFDFADGANTNGDVYKNLIALCKDEVSLVINGAVIGQDTVNGNRSKEQVSLGLLDAIVTADKRRLEMYWNYTILPALVRIGFLPDGLTYELQPQEDLEKLFDQTHKLLQYMEVEPEWVKNKFGIEVTGVRQSQSLGANLSVGSFFD